MRAYPDDLPSVPVASDQNLCLNCEYGTQLHAGIMDVNNCAPLENWDHHYDQLSASERERFKELDKSETRCPFYRSKN